MDWDEYYSIICKPASLGGAGVDPLSFQNLTLAQLNSIFYEKDKHKGDSIVSTASVAKMQEEYRESYKKKHGTYPPRSPSV